MIDARPGPASVKLTPEVMRLVADEAADRGTFKTRVLQAMAELWRQSPEPHRASALRAVGHRAAGGTRVIEPNHGPRPADHS